MKPAMLSALLLILSAHITTSAVTEDVVHSLPGWEGELPSKHYSGMISVGADKNRHVQTIEILTSLSIGPESNG